jgi:hypothetical protein
MNPIKQAKLEKAINEIDSTFVGEVRGMTLVQCKDRLSKLSLDAQAVVMAKENDQELEDARANVKEMSSPYRESLKKLRQKIDFLLTVMEEKNIPESK